MDSTSLVKTLVADAGGLRQQLDDAWHAMRHGLVYAWHLRQGIETAEKIAAALREIAGDPARDVDADIKAAAKHWAPPAVKCYNPACEPCSPTSDNSLARHDRPCEAGGGDDEHVVGV